MQEVASTPQQVELREPIKSSVFACVRSQSPSLTDVVVALFSAGLLVISFPNFNFWPLAWVAVCPLLIVISRRPKPIPSFLLGWLFGSVFFFSSCSWLTYSIIHFGGFSAWAAYPMLIPGALILGLFPGLFAALLARAVERWGLAALFIAPPLWAATEWARLEVTGQLWNAIGYSQTFHPSLIQTAQWGGVYLVSFLILLVNAAVGYGIVKRNAKAVISSAVIISCVLTLALGLAMFRSPKDPTNNTPVVQVIAIQPNVPMDLVKTSDEMAQLNLRHFAMSEAALATVNNKDLPSLLIWPESPMNFTYGADSQFREKLAAFAVQHHTSVLFNSQEAAPNGGVFNSALLINEHGSLVAQYDKIRLMPFGEYVPLPQWLPGAGLIRGIVGDFTPGAKYPLMQVGNARAGVFICIESAYPSIARTFTREGADLLINISNDGYLGPTAVLHQHLANAVFRAVENNRPLLRVTNTGITAFITPQGYLISETRPFEQEVRTWTVSGDKLPPSFYAKYGDVFVGLCAVLSVGVFALSFKRKEKRSG